MIDFTFVNGSAPYLNAENLNSIVGSINDNESSISVLEDIVDDLTHEIVPESIVKEAVDDYVEEHSAGFATETELQSLNESLTNLNTDLTQLQIYRNNGGATKIGTYNGSDLYRQTFVSNISFTANEEFSKSIATFSQSINVKEVNGVIKASNGDKMQIGGYLNSSYYCGCFFPSGSIAILGKMGSNTNATVEISIIYTVD